LGLSAVTTFLNNAVLVQRGVSMRQHASCPHQTLACMGSLYVTQPNPTNIRYKPSKK